MRGDQCFNPRPRAGGDSAGVLGGGFSRWFQSAPPCGGRQGREEVGWRSASFNPRPRAGGDRQIDDVAARIEQVSIRAPVRGATRCGVLKSPTGHVVSIRAPVRGATWSRENEMDNERFQSAPPCGGRLGRRPTSTGARCFNPRPRAGGDSTPWPAPTHPTSFNPRPRAGGDTGRLGPCYTPYAGFNPRPRAGGDQSQVIFESEVVKFQSAPPCGGRHRRPP